MPDRAPLVAPKQLTTGEVNDSIQALLIGLDRARNELRDYDIQLILRALNAAAGTHMHQLAILNAEADVKRRAEAVRNQSRQLADAEERLAALRAVDNA